MSLNDSNKIDSKSNSPKRKKSRSRDKINKMDVSNDEDSLEGNKLTRKTYTIKDKLKFIRIAEARGIKSTAKKYGIGLTSLKRWIKQKEKLKGEDKPKHKFNLPGAGRIPNTLDIEDQLCTFIKQCNSLGIAISSTEIIHEAIKLDNNLKDKTIYALHAWYYRFIQRNGFAIRRITHIGQAESVNSKEFTDKFFEIIYYKRLNNNIYDKLGLIGNMDETAISYENIYTTTVTKIGNTTVNVKNFNRDKMRITVLLSILADGTKLPPLIIFRGETNKTKEKKLQNNKYVINGKCYVKCQRNAWADNNIFNYWLNNIWFNNGILNHNIKNTLLILDRATTHFSSDLNERFKKYESHFVLIPPGLTRYLQPLDVAVNKPFKDAMKNSDCKFRLKTNNNKLPDEEEIISQVVENWFDNNIIKKDTIIKSFKRTGISILMNGSENNLVNLPEFLSDELPIPNDININEKIDNFKDELFITSKYDDPNQPKLNTYFKELKDK